MTEHVHDYQIMATIPYLDSHCRPFAYCRDIGCDAEFEKDEIERRLNATERLSAGAADYAAEFTQAGTNKHSMDQESEGNVYFLTDALRAYAAALEKE